MTTEHVLALRPCDEVIWDWKDRHNPRPVKGRVIRSLDAGLRTLWEDGLELAVYLSKEKVDPLAERLKKALKAKTTNGGKHERYRALHAPLDQV
jgi:hypothetical protein